MEVEEQPSVSGVQKEQSEENDISKTLDLLNNIKKNCASTNEFIRNLYLRIKDGQLPSEKGISFLDIKNQMLLSYLIDMTYLMLIKIQGQQICGDEVINRLVEHRTVIEKMRPIDYKLKYQIDKLIKISTTGNINEDDPLRLRPQLDKLDDDQEMDNDDDDDDEPQKSNKQAMDSDVKNVGKYMVPKVAAMKYEMEEEKKKKALERAKKRAMSSSIIQELKREFDDGPEEVRETGNFMKKRLDKEIKERINYEESNMLRINLTKKQRNESKKLMTMSSLSSMTHFEDISALDIDNAMDFSVQKKKRSKGAGKKSQSKKFKKRKFKK